MLASQRTMSSTARLNASKGAMPLATPRSRVLGVCAQRQGSYPCFSPGAVIGRGRTFTAKASSSSTDGNNLSMSRDGNGLFIGSQRSGDGGGNGGRGGGGGRGGSGGSSGDGAAHPMRLWTFIFAGVLALGGALAYFRKSSGKSLGASLSASFILLLCARSMVGASAAGAARVAFGLTLMLGIAMVNRFTKTKKVMPAGLVAGSSLCMAMGYLITGL